MSDCMTNVSHRAMRSLIGHLGPSVRDAGLPSYQRLGWFIMEARGCAKAILPSLPSASALICGSFTNTAVAGGRLPCIWCNGSWLDGKRFIGGNTVRAYVNANEPLVKARGSTV